MPAIWLRRRFAGVGGEAFVSLRAFLSVRLNDPLCAGRKDECLCARECRAAEASAAPSTSTPWQPGLGCLGVSLTCSESASAPGTFACEHQEYGRCYTYAFSLPHAWMDAWLSHEGHQVLRDEYGGCRHPCRHP